MHASSIILYAAISAFITVGLGAFGAHGLAAILGERLATWQTAVHYQMFHTIALLALGVLAIALPGLQASALLKWTVLLFLLGIILFSGSLYVLALSGITRLGMITPLGGLAFLAGWLLLACLAVKEV